MKKIAVVILNWNGAKLLEQFLPSVIAFSDQAQIYVADNASKDDSISILKSKFPSVIIIQNVVNYGFAKGYNQALKQVEEPIFALLNSDVEVSQNWLQPIIDVFESQPKTAIIQPKILDFKNKAFFEYAGAAGGFIDRFGYPYCRGRIFDTIEKDFGQYDDESDIFWASGACFFIRKSIFEELNGFDEDFFAHQEEIDLCWRTKNAGKSIKYTSKSIVFHVGGATLDSSNPTKTFLNFRNSLLMLTKNLPTNRIIPILFVRLLLDGLAGIKFIFKGKIQHFLAIINAHFSFYNMFFKALQKRNGHKSKDYYRSKSIVYTYFVKKRHYF